MWKVFCSSILLLNPFITTAQDVIKPNFKLKKVEVLANPTISKTFIKYPSFKFDEEPTENKTPLNEDIIKELKEQNKILIEYISRDKKAKEVVENENIMNTIEFSLPVDVINITSGYGYRNHPITKQIKFHYGIDIRAQYEPVKSILNGIVIEAKRNLNKGRYICIKSNDIEFRYYHLDEIYVRKGQVVNSGEIIGKSGNTGLSNAPHLHLEALINQKHINPNTLLIKLNNLYKNQKL